MAQFKDDHLEWVRLMLASECNFRTMNATAKRIGISTATASRIVSGKKPSVDIFLKLLKRYGGKISYPWIPSDTERGK